MATVLLIVIYIAFIGLGLPDSIFGAAWPAIYSEFNYPFSVAGYITMISSGCTAVSSIMSGKLINRFGTGKVTAVSTAMTAVALLGWAFSQNIAWFFAMAVCLGSGAGAIDTGLNNYVALNYKAMHMNFLHCFYGIGVSLSPYLISIMMAETNEWRRGYLLIFWIQLIITVLMFASLPLWKKAEQKAEEEVNVKAKILSVSELMKVPYLKAAWLIFLTSCSMEFICGTWGSTFFVNSKGMSEAQAAGAITLYYIGMTAGRFLSGILAIKLNSRQIINLGKWVVLLAIAVIAMPVKNGIIAAVGLFLVGLGNGPVFPNMTHLAPHTFGAEISQSVIGSQMAASYVGMMFMPYIFGMLAQVFTTDIFPIALIVLYVVMFASIKILFKKRNNI